MLIIADIAGQFQALKRLVGRVDTSEPILGVGDLMDRGRETPEVIEWFMSTDRADSLYGNHEDLMLDFIIRNGAEYGPECWLANGGAATLASYGIRKKQVSMKEIREKVPVRHLQWLATRRSVHLDDGLVVTHAPIHARYGDQYLGEMTRMDGQDPETTILWNRGEPRRRDRFQVFGHNSHWGLRKFEDPDGTWAVCLDQSRTQILTGFHWPSGEIFEEPYEEAKNARTLPSTGSGPELPIQPRGPEEGLPRTLEDSPPG